MKELIKRVKKWYINYKKNNDIKYLQNKIKSLQTQLNRERKRCKILSYDNRMIYARSKKSERLYKELKENVNNGKV